MTEKREIELFVTLDKSDAYKTGMLVFREAYKWQYRLALAASLLFCLFFLAVHFGAPQERRWELYSFDVAIVPPIVIFLFPYMVIGAAARATFRANPRASQTTRLVFSSEGILSESSFGRSETKWGMYARVRETKEYFLLYPSLKVAHGLPKRCFTSADALATFRDILRTSIAGRIDLES
jgi:hypothetical protein